jgi:hypothetical protein
MMKVESITLSVVAKQLLPESFFQLCQKNIINRPAFSAVLTRQNLAGAH